jgi:hypothetical protein
MSWPEEMTVGIRSWRFWNFEFHISHLACLASPVFLASLALRSEMATSRGEIGIMPQDMVDRSLSDSDRSTRSNDP